MDYKFDQEIDCSGLSCPMPILKTKKAIDTLQAGQVLKMIATDPASLSDIQAWTSRTGHELLGYETEGEKFIFYIKHKQI
jgi:tRNA 2-thiouridine synthesizing protein A